MGIQKNDHRDLERTGFGHLGGPGKPELVTSVLGELTPRTLGLCISAAGVTFLGENMSLAQLRSPGHHLRREWHF